MNEEIYHVVPVNDILKHEISSGCHCRPVLKEGVWVHNSYDGREVLEQGRELLNNRN